MSSIMHTTATRRLADAKVQATYGIRETNHRYFSATYSQWNKYASTNTDPQACGFNPALICRVFPELADLVALHLSNAETGEPMHAAANAFYQLNNKADRAEGEQAAADYLRTTPERVSHVQTAEDMSALVDELRPEWAEQARAAREKYDLN